MSADEVAELDPTFGKAVDAWLTWLRANGAPQVYILSGRRSEAEQWALRVQNCPDPANSPSGDCDPPTAKVGQSQHGRGLAVDIAPASAYAAAGAAAASFGLRATVGGEPWHFELSAGDPPTANLAGGPVGAAVGGLGDLAGSVLGGGVGSTRDALAALSRLADGRFWLRVGVGTIGVGLVAAGGLAVLGQQARSTLAGAV